MATPTGRSGGRRWGVSTAACGENPAGAILRAFERLRAPPADGWASRPQAPNRTTRDATADLAVERGWSGGCRGATQRRLHRPRVFGLFVALVVGPPR